MVAAITGWIFVGIIASIVLASVVFLFVDAFKGYGRDRSMLWHRMNGQYRVQYPGIDPHTGKNYVSQPMSRSVAKDYAEMFNGTVISK
jgi:hypothetical protein